MQRTNLLNWAIRRLLIWLLVLGGGYLLVFGGSSTSSPVRRRIAVEVATPQGTKRGASVIELVHSHASVESNAPGRSSTKCLTARPRQ